MTEEDMLTADVLPVTLELGETDADYEALGFIFGEPLAEDPLFRAAKLPEGWSRQPTRKPRWMGLVDADGVLRVGVFYRSTTQDRRSGMRIHTSSEQ